MSSNRHGNPPDNEAVVRCLLMAAGLKPTDDEVEELVLAYPEHRRALKQLYAVMMPKEERPQPVLSFEIESVSDDSL